MKKAFNSVLILYISLIGLLQPAAPATLAGTTNTSNAYALGVNMGFASFQSVVGSSASYGPTYDALVSARISGTSVQAIVPQLNFSLLDPLITQLKHNAAEGRAQKLAKLSPTIVSIRGEYSAVLRKASVPLGNAYDLGVAVAIAEGQASIGDAARQIVRSSLVSAKGREGSLGIGESGVDAIIQHVDQGGLIGAIHNQISSLRNKYQVLLEGAVKAAPAGGKNTPKIEVTGTTKSPDQVLLDAGCNRVPGKPGAYDCFTQKGFDACNSYKAQGKATSCVTKLDQVAQKKMDDDLFSQGCRRFLGRPDQYLCTTQRGATACESYKRAGRATMCKLAIAK